MDAIIIWLIQTTNTNTGDGGGAAQRGSLVEGESISHLAPRNSPSPAPSESQLHFTSVYFLFQFVI